MNQEPISTLKGIGEKTEKLFKKLGLDTTSELLHYYPKGYDTYEDPISISLLKPNTYITVAGNLATDASITRVRNLQIITTTLKEGASTLTLIWYNMPYLRATLTTGSYFIFKGRVIKKKNRLVMEQPELFTKETFHQMRNTMQPIYGQTKGLNNKTIVKAVRQALDTKQMVRDYMPLYLRQKYQLAEYNFALEHIHFPVDQQDLLFARKRLVFDEFFLFILAVRRLREKRQGKNSLFPVNCKKEVTTFLNALPYELTGAQKQVLEEVENDLQSGKVMNRLIQGDVGSGKTIIAILALLQVAYNGYQSALMVPTEVLAKQHYESITQLFDAYQIPKKIVLLTGSMTAKEKQKAYEWIANHEVDIIVGTHALIQDKVIYDQLALVITDEQHRFGVGQRETLSLKGRDPHVLVMSATPIPRTIAIILYGDLDISVIDEMPANRLPIKNCVVNTQYRKKAYDFMASEIANGHQVYIICPMVEESEMIEAENVIDYTQSIRSYFKQEIRIEYLHGKMKAKAKNELMEQFATNEIQILVSTTVIEVGINVPNATIMMIENAERFGLAQLHQLRGRVGRGKAQSYCIMVNASEQEQTQKRLHILNHSNDGFYIASEDLKLRGPGDIFGIRQSGDMEFKIADIFTDANLLKLVSKEVDQLLKKDPNLLQKEHVELKKKEDDFLQKNLESLNL